MSNLPFPKCLHTMNEWDVIIDLIGEKSLSSLGKKSLHLSKILPLQEVLTEFEMIKEVGTLSGIKIGRAHV